MNVFCSFKNITSWSKDDLTDWSAVTGFAPDSAKSWAYLVAAVPANALALAASGSGISNNRRDAPYVSRISSILNKLKIKLFFYQFQKFIFNI